MKKTLLFACLLALCNLTLFAQTVKSHRIMHTTPKSAVHVPPQEPDVASKVALKKIYSNLGKSKTDLYNCCTAYGLWGPNSGWGSAGSSSFAAIPFTPKSNSTVMQAQAALQENNGGTNSNQINLSIYSDASGTPGTLLTGPVTITNLPNWGTCCTLAIANFTPTVAVTAGTQYWLVADGPLSGTGSDFGAMWDLVYITFPMSFDESDAGWFAATVDDGLPAGEVLGTIP